MRRPNKSRPLALALALAASLVLPANPGRVDAASPPDQPRQQPLAVSSGTGETRREIDQAGEEFFSVVDGFDLDQYLFRSSSEPPWVSWRLG